MNRRFHQTTRPGGTRFVVVAAVVVLLSGLLGACATQPVLSGFQVTPTVISPNGHSPNGVTTIKYQVGQRSDVSIALVGQNGKQYLLRNQATRPVGSYQLTFAGAYDGRVLPDGQYRVQITAQPPGSQTVVQRLDGTLTIRQGDSTPPAITEIGAFPNPFHPNGNLATDVTVIHYTLSKPATVTITAVGKQTGKRYDILFNRIQLAGPQDATWKGLVGNVDAVPDDDYTVHIIAKDAAGNVTQQTTLVKVRDSGVPQAQIIGVHFSEVTHGAQKLLKVQVQVENTGTAILYAWGPKPGYVYPSLQSSYLTPPPSGPGLPEEMAGRAGKYSVGVDFVRQPLDPPPYPFRWSFGQNLQPKAVATVVGYVQLAPTETGDFQLYAGLIHEGQGILSGQDHMGLQQVNIR